ncbi:MAG: hypothetical protein H6626_05335 [Pseudobdellovibrionaceae bacterium]|nr:MAG: hypothetical protein H6626_05335 [Pseudobdellovibrionaceae bacterium]
MNEIEKRIQFAKEWIETITPTILDVYYNQSTYDLKSNNSEVTEADRNTERDFRNKIKNLFSDDGIIGEEFPDENKENSNFTWTIDPIDGTRAFVHGVPFFGSMIGLIHDGQPIFGIIKYHALNETIYAIRSKGAYWKSPISQSFVRCQASKTSNMSEAVFCLSGEEYFKMHEKQHIYDSLNGKFKFTRTWGDCYGYCLVARGKIDLMIDPAFHVWDSVPLKIITEEAGAVYLDIEGNQSPQSPLSAVCGSPHIVEAIVPLLKVRE